MASTLSDTEAHNLLNYRWRGSAWTPPATYYFGLSSTQPTSAGANITEPTDSSYARVAVTKSTGNFNAASGRATTNAVDITYPAPSGGGSGYVNQAYVPVFDAATAGTFLGYFTITGGAVTFAASVTPRIPASSLSGSIAA